MVRRDGARVRCFTRNGRDWADRFPSIVDAAHRIKPSSFLLDGEAVIASDDGTPDFHALRSRRRGREALTPWILFCRLRESRVTEGAVGGEFR